MTPLLGPTPCVAMEPSLQKDRHLPTSVFGLPTSVFGLPTSNFLLYHQSTKSTKSHQRKPFCQSELEPSLQKDRHLRDLRSSNFGLRSSVFRLPLLPPKHQKHQIPPKETSCQSELEPSLQKGSSSSDFQLRSSVFPLPPSPFRLRSSVFQLQSPVFRLPTSVFGLRSSDFQLSLPPFPPNLHTS